MDGLDELFERSKMLFNEKSDDFTEADWLQLERDYTAYIKGHMPIPDLSLRLWRDSCFEAVFMICDGIRFENDKNSTQA